MAWLVVLAICVAIGTPLSTEAQGDGASSPDDQSSAWRPSPRVDLEVGYFTARREIFRELYGSYFDYGICYQRTVGKQWTGCLRAEFVRLAKHGPQFKYWSLSLAPYLQRHFCVNRKLSTVAGAGVGLSYREVNTQTTLRVSGRIPPYTARTATQKELAVFLSIVGGLNFDLFRRFAVGARVYFDYYPFGDPTVGDFGDTGGFHLMGRLGFML